MRYFLSLFIVLFLLDFSISEAQVNLRVKKRDFKAGKTGFKDAWKHIDKGDSYYTGKGTLYGNAYNEYIIANQYNSSNPELNYKIGASALFSDKKEAAAGFLLKAYQLKSDVAEDILLLTGRGLQYSGRFAEAAKKYDDYLRWKGKKSKEKIALAKKCIEECNSALIVTKDTLRVEIKNLGANINTNTDDYSEVLTADNNTMYFASRRKMPKSKNNHPELKYDENIFFSNATNGVWGMAALAGKNLTTKYCESPVYIDSSGKKLYIYAGYENGGDIKVSVYKKGKWKKPESIPYAINTKGSETSFCINPAGNEIYFVSDKGKNNLGGKDIYYIKKLNKRKWSKPQNAGPLVNSAYDEESVRFSAKGDTLWFSSKGHNTIGGFDIFYSVRNKAGDWDTVRNAGYPINTPFDELFYYPSSTENKTFYFASNRGGGFGGLDIYKGHFLPPPPAIVVAAPLPAHKPDTVVIRDTVVVVKAAPPTPVAVAQPVKEVVLYLIGKIKDSESGEPVMAKIDVIEISSNTVMATTASSDVDGSYRVRLPARKSYMIDLRATGFLSDMKRINISDTYDKEAFNLDVSLIKVKVGKKVVLKNILFESGKSVLTSGSYPEIDKLFSIMQDNPLMRIEISGHTDKTGLEPLNFKLSEARAKAVMDYLVSKGIDKSRIEYRGYGSLQAIAENSTPQGRAKNRRVEFKILEF
jgi:outer membrane protein OmpA-like peptidoglycan-associated protein